MSSIQVYSDETVLPPDPPASSKSSPGSKVIQFWVNLHWRFLELSLPWLIPRSFGWALTRLHHPWCTSVSSLAEMLWFMTGMTMTENPANLSSLVPGQPASIHEVQDPSDDPWVQADPDQYVFPLKNNTSQLSQQRFLTSSRMETPVFQLFFLLRQEQTW